MNDQDGEQVTAGVVDDQHEPAAQHVHPPAGEDQSTAKITVNQQLRDDRGDDSGAGRRAKVMLLGSDEWSRELAIALQRLGAEVIAVDRHPDAPAHRVADQSMVVAMTDTDELAATIGRVQPNFVVPLTDAVSTDALRAAAETGFAEVIPSVRGVLLSADREQLRRLAADELGLPTAPFWFAGSVEELRAVAAHAGFPLLVAPVVAPPGQGQSVLLRLDDVEPAWQRAMSGGASGRVLAETVVEIDSRVTLLTVLTTGPAGPVIDFCAPIGHGEPAGDAFLESWQPQQLSTPALDVAKSVAARIVKALGGRGLFGVELMVRGDEIYFSDITSRPYGSALVTLRTQRLSGFELAARAILGMAVDTIMISPGAARVLDPAGQAAGPIAGGGTVADALRVPESDVRVLGYHARVPRRLSVALATAPDTTVARDRARQVSTALRKLRQP